MKNQGLQRYWSRAGKSLWYLPKEINRWHRYTIPTKEPKALSFALRDDQMEDFDTPNVLAC